MYVCAALAPACGPTAAEPSPKSNLYVAMGVESPSLDPDASAVTCNGAMPELGLTLMVAFGGGSGGALTVTWVVAVDELSAVFASPAMISPAWGSCAGFLRAPFTFTNPPLIASAASVRDL